MWRIRAGSGVSPVRPRAHPPRPTQGELQRVLPAVPRHALGRRHLFPRRCGTARGCARGWSPGGGRACSPRFPGLSQAPQPCADCSTCLRASATSRDTRARRSSGNSGRTSGKHGREGSLPDAALRVGGGERRLGTRGKEAFGDRRWADLARGGGSSPVGGA